VGPGEIEAVHYVRRRSRWLATQISIKFGPIDEDTRDFMEALMRQTLDKKSQIEKYLSQESRREPQQLEE
jgi:hypothetical protein